MKNRHSNGKQVNQFACLSSQSRSAIATIWLTGKIEQLNTAIDARFHSASKKKAADLRMGKLAYGDWKGESAEGVVLYKITETEFEIHCHGGIAAQSTIAAHLKKAGFSELSWEDWENSSTIDIIQAEAISTLRQAKTERTAEILLDQYEGMLKHEVQSALGYLQEGDIKKTQAIVTKLSNRISIGQHLVDPFQVVIAGQPNVGKSSLINCLVGYERAIVFDQPGTTRDIVSTSTAIAGWPVELSDTAGIRESNHSVESAGVARAIKRAESAELLIIVFDSTAQIGPEEKKLLTQFPEAIVVLNKLDLCKTAQSPEVLFPQKTVRTSTVTGIGIEQLTNAIADWITQKVPDNPFAVPFTKRQFGLLYKASQATADSTSNLRSTLSAIIEHH